MADQNVMPAPGGSRHNKKRNVGLLYEFLIQYISKSLVEGDDRKARKAVKLIRRHFKPGTELYREFRLFNALVRTKVSSTGVAESILKEAKTAAKNYDSKVLDREKSLLIRGINHTFNDPSFYQQRIDEYRMFATIQTLFNDWRDSGATNISRIATYEDQIVGWLTEGEEVIEESNTFENVDSLVVKLMLEKVNQKYHGKFNDEQREIVKQYAFSLVNDDQTQLKEALVTLRDSAVNDIDKYVEGNNRNYVIPKLNEARDFLVSDSMNEVNDDLIVKLLKVSKLRDEINDKGDS